MVGPTPKHFIIANFGNKQEKHLEAFLRIHRYADYFVVERKTPYDMPSMRWQN